MREYGYRQPGVFTTPAICTQVAYLDTLIDTVAAVYTVTAHRITAAQQRRCGCQCEGR